MDVAWREVEAKANLFDQAQRKIGEPTLTRYAALAVCRLAMKNGYIKFYETTDKKQLVTPNHLKREIQDEVYVNNGKVSFEYLERKLKVERVAIEEVVAQLDSDYSVIDSKVIHIRYEDYLIKQIRQVIMKHDRLVVDEFAMQRDIPRQYLSNLLESLKAPFFKSLDGLTYYSSDIIDRYKAKVAGSFSAISSPTPIASFKHLKVPETLLLSILQELIKEKRLPGRIEHKTFTPLIYDRQLSKQVDEFFKSNLYIEYNMLAKMKMDKSVLNKFQGVHLKTCFVSPHLLDQIESLVEESLTTSGWSDLTTVVPPFMDDQDLTKIVEKFSKALKQSFQTCDSSIVYNDTFSKACEDELIRLIPEKAKEDLEAGKLRSYFAQMASKDKSEDESDGEDMGKRQNKREQRKEKSSGGAGSQGREIKRKAVKKKYIPGSKDKKKDTNTVQLTIGFTLDEIVNVLQDKNDDCPTQLIEQLAESILKKVNSQYMSVAAEYHLRDVREREAKEREIKEKAAREKEAAKEKADNEVDQKEHSGDEQGPLAGDNDDDG